MLAYEDGPAAMDWLAEAFGFVETNRSVSDAGTLEHGEMTSGGATIMQAPSEAYEGPNGHRAHCQAADAWLSSPYVVDGVLVHVDDVDAHRWVFAAERSPRRGDLICSSTCPGRGPRGR